VNTESEQSSDFLKRVLDALDMPLLEVSHRFDIPLTTLLEMYKGTRLEIAAVDHDEFWVLVAGYVDERIAQLMSVREELQRKLSKERKIRAAHRLRIEER